MVKAHTPWPCPQHVAWPSPYSNCFCTFPEPSLCGHSAFWNPSTCITPAIGAFPGFTVAAASNLKTNEVQGFRPCPYLEPNLRDVHTGAAIQLQNANPESLQKKLLIFDQCGNKTRLFHSPILPLVHHPIQVYDLKEEEKATYTSQKNIPKSKLTEKSDEDHLVNERSEMHEDTEEINALLYSDDSDFDNDGNDYDDEVTSTGHSPLVTKTFVMQEQFGDLKEEVGSSDWPNKRQKFTDDGYVDRSSFRACGTGSASPNEACEYGSDTKSKYFNGDNSGDIQSEKDKIRETLRVLENIVPGAKGKHPMLVIDETIEYLESLITETGAHGLKF